jgi:hypothetical protein
MIKHLLWAAAVAAPDPGATRMRDTSDEAPKVSRAREQAGGRIDDNSDAVGASYTEPAPLAALFVVDPSNTR